MKVPRECESCHKKYPESGFETTIDTSCKSCVLKIKRLIFKFSEMVASPDTGLSELDVYLNNWYGVS